MKRPARRADPVDDHFIGPDYIVAVATNDKNASKKNAQAAAKVRAAQQQKKQRMQWSIGIIVLVVAGVVVLVLAKSSKSDSTTTVSKSAKTAPASIATDLAAVPIPAIAAAAKKITPQNGLQPTPDKKKRLVNGKPEVLYIGAEFCPYCAGERWALVVALSKFGEFSGLKTIHSSESSVPTLSFVGSKYTSDYVSFKPIELQDQDGKPLESATDAEMDLFKNLGGGSFPFIDFGGLKFQKGGSVDIATLLGKSQTEIASKLAASTESDTDNSTLQGNVNAVAGTFIREICDQTGDKPAKVCKAILAP